MKRYLVAAMVLVPSLAIAEPPTLPLEWQEVDHLYITTGPARMYSNNVVWGGTHMGAGDYGASQEGQWHTVDLQPWGVDEDAKVAFLSGILIITSGTTNEIADMTIVFRRPGDNYTTCDKYMGQATLSGFGGQRSGFASWVPVKWGKIEFCYKVSTPGTWPAHAAYGVNLSIQGWAD